MLVIIFNISFQEDYVLDQNNALVTDFEDHAEKMCRIANLAAASSTDGKRMW